MVRKLLAAWVSVTFAAANSGCAPAKSPWFHAESGATPARLDLSVLVEEPGIREYRLGVPELGARSIEAWLPPSGPPKMLVTFLHGAIARQRGKRFGSDGVTHELLRCLVVPALGALEPLVIAPRSADGEWWEDAETRFVLGLREAAFRRFPSIGRRHVVVGYSNGGIGAWYFARIYPEYFSAAIPIAANDTIAGESPLPVYAIHGTRDEVFPIAGVRTRVRELEQTRADVRLVEKYRGGHYDPCSYTTELEGARAWLEQRGLATP
jgi:pimeloyl-ACP methyl ester carboxylesterase